MFVQFPLPSAARPIPTRSSAVSPWKVGRVCASDPCSRPSKASFPRALPPQKFPKPARHGHPHLEFVVFAAEGPTRALDVELQLILRHLPLALLWGLRSMGLSRRARLLLLLPRVCRAACSISPKTGRVRTTSAVASATLALASAKSAPNFKWFREKHGTSSNECGPLGGRHPLVSAILARWVFCGVSGVEAAATVLRSILAANSGAQLLRTTPSGLTVNSGGEFCGSQRGQLGGGTI